MQAEQVDQVIGEAVQEQTEGVGQKAVTAQAVGAETVFELLDAVLAFATIIVKRKDLRGAARSVGDQEAQIGARDGVLGLVADAALTRPRTGAMREAGETALRDFGVAIAAF